MLLLESFDTVQRSASFLALTNNSLRVREDFARLAEVAADLGLRGLLLHFASTKGEITQLEAYMGPERRGSGRACLGSVPLCFEAGPGQLSALPTLQLRGCMKDGQPYYEMSLAATEPSRPLLDAGLVMMLATWGSESVVLLDLRTALFEIGSHFLDHAENLRTAQAAAAASLDLSLRFCDEGIEGWLSDDGPRFDPASCGGAHLREASKTRDRSLESEVGWFCRLLDSYEHCFDGSGNRVGFFKKVGR